MVNMQVVKNGFSKTDTEGSYTEFWVLRGENLTAENIREHLSDHAYCATNGHYTGPGGSFSQTAAVWINQSGKKALVTQRSGYDI